MGKAIAIWYKKEGFREPSFIVKKREKIIDRLIKLQQGEIEVKDYKMIDEYILEEARDKLEQEKKTKAKRNKEAR